MRKTKINRYQPDGASNEDEDDDEHLALLLKEQSFENLGLPSDDPPSLEEDSIIDQQL